MPQRPFVSLFLFALSASSLLAGLRVSEPQPFPPQFEPAAPRAPVELTANDGVFLATYFATWPPNWEVIRLDAEGDPLDIPPLSLGRPFERSERISGAVPEGTGWLIASRQPAEPGIIQVIIERLSRDGAVSVAGDFTVAASLRRFHLAGSDGSYAVLTEREGTPETAAIVTFDSAIRASAPLIVDGVPLAIAAGGGRFAALLHDRVLIVTPEPRVEMTIPLPPLVEAKTIVPFGSTFVILGIRGSSIELLSVQESAIVSLASIPAGDYINADLDASGDALLVLWTTGSPSDIFAARVAEGGAVDGPFEIGSGRAGVEVEGDEDGWLTLHWIDPWIAVSRRIGRSEPLSNLSDDLDPVKWIAYPQYASAIATSGDTALAIWRRQCASDDDLFGCEQVLARRFDPRGVRVDSEDTIVPGQFGAIDGAVGRPGGFLMYGSGHSFFAYAWDDDATFDPTPIVIADARVEDEIISCAGDFCLAAWRDPEWATDRPAVRVARIQGRTVLDPGGIPVAYETGRGKIGVASDGTRFLVASARGVTNGTIVGATLVDPRGSLDYRRFDVTAVSPPDIFDLRVLWTGSLFEVYQSVQWANPLTDQPHRIARVAPDGSVREGEESGWAGWVLDIEGAALDAFHACGESYFATAPHYPSGSIMYQTQNRSAQAIWTAPLKLKDVACFEGGGCLGIGDSTGSPSVGYTGLVIVPMSCERERLVVR